MESRYPSFEFQERIEKGGRISLPQSLSQLLNPGTHVIVKITKGTVSQSLRARHVTESDIEQLAATQLEQRDSVLRFLSAEGALAGHTLFITRRARRNYRRT